MNCCRCADGVRDHVDQPGEAAADLLLDLHGGDHEVEVLRAEPLGHVARAPARSGGRAALSASTRWNSLLAGGVPSSTIVCRPCLKLWPALSAAASVISTSGELVLERLRRRVALIQTKPTGASAPPASTASSDRASPVRRPRDRAPSEPAAEHQVDELDRAERQVAALDQALESLPELPVLPNALSVARKRAARLRRGAPSPA